MVGLIAPYPVHPECYPVLPRPGVWKGVLHGHPTMAHCVLGTIMLCTFWDITVLGTIMLCTMGDITVLGTIMLCTMWDITVLDNIMLCTLWDITVFGTILCTM